MSTNYSEYVSMFNFPFLFSFQDSMKCLVRAIFFIIFFARNISVYILIAIIQCFCVACSFLIVFMLLYV